MMTMITASRGRRSLAGLALASDPESHRAARIRIEQALVWRCCVPIARNSHAERRRERPILQPAAHSRAGPQSSNLGDVA